MRKGITAKIAALLVTCALVCCSVIGGTIAWLIDTPDPVVNTFTYGDINITLEESNGPIPDGDGDPNTNTYKMIPGVEITKDPKVTVEAGSEEMWLFVKLEESENFSDFMEYTVDGSWAALDDVDGVYYRHITAEEIKDNNLVAHVLQDDKVVVKDSVTKEMLNALNPENADAAYPTLTVSAYAIQHEGFATAIDGWNAIIVANTPTNP